MKKLLTISTVMIELTLIVGIVLIGLQFGRIRPQLKEEMVSVQTVKLDGEIYICGTVIGDRDKESLYCRGFTDGYSWAIGQLKIGEQLSR